MNSRTKRDEYSLPYLHDFTDQLDGAKCFSSLDLFKSYHQIPLCPENKEKTTICTPAGNFQFRRLSMGLCNAAQSFQRFMNSIFIGLPFVFIYLDDILIFSRSKEEHKQHLQQDFQCLAAHGLVINASKCKFGIEELRFLGHYLTTQVIKPVDEKVAVINNFRGPETVKQLSLTVVGRFEFSMILRATPSVVFNHFHQGHPWR